MIYTKIITGVGAAFALYATAQIALAKNTISKQVDRIEILEANNAWLETNVTTMADNLVREIEARNADIARWEETLQIHGRYLRTLRQDAKKWQELRNDIDDIEGATNRSSEYLIRVGRRLWPNEETTDATDTDSLTNLSGAGEAERTE